MRDGAPLPPRPPVPAAAAAGARGARLWPLWVAIGLVAGLLIGLGGGYAAFRNTPSGTTASTPSVSPSASPADTPTALPKSPPASSPTPVPTRAPRAAPTPAPSPPPSGWTASGRLSDPSFSGCPSPASGQHVLAPVTGPTAAGAAAGAGNEWYGCGNVLMAQDNPVVTADNWELAVSFSCPDADAPPAVGVTGMAIEAFVYAGGGKPIQNGANTQTVDLPWTDNQHAGVPQGGNYRLRTRLENGAVGDNRCHWHIRAFHT